MTSSATRTRHMAALAEQYDGVLSRTQLRDWGVDRNVVARQVDSERWRVVGRETVATHTRQLTFTAQAWRAIWEVGCAHVALDGASALRVAGLTGYDSPGIDVSIPWEKRIGRRAGVNIHRVCWEPDNIVYAGLPRVRPPVAAVRAGHWASTDRQAALILVMPVQQRLLRADDLREASKTDRVRGRRDLVRQLVGDIVDGAQSLGELDFAALCRKRGLPVPDRQAVIRSQQGRVYLDARWSGIGLVVEIDGSGHRQGLSVMFDGLRQNRVTIGGDMVLRFDLFAIRLHPDEVLDQVCDAHAVLSARRRP